MNFKKLVASVAMTASAALMATGAQAEAKVDPKLPSYEKVGGVSGNISSVGSDTLANLMTFWAEEFKKQYPNVAVQIQAAGSSTAPPALTEGTSNLGPMSRKMKDKELEAFEKKFGYKPTAVPVAIDALAVFVNKDNPIKGMSIEQVDAVFSSTRNCGAANDATKWGDLGLSGEWKNRDIQMYGRNSVSGTYGYFKKVALCKGDYKSNVNEQPGSASVVQSVATSLNGIGYSGIGYKTSSVRALPLAKGNSSDYVEASPEAALSGKYPLSRALYVYVNKAPGKPLPPLEREFIKMVMSKQGQEIVVKDGYIPMPSSMVAKVLNQLGIESEIAAK
ncbi:MAG: phosphate-binding protein [Pseudomonadales bacterium]|nr:phosphate-binding protein [Pseudomonadales bacterium]